MQDTSDRDLAIASSIRYPAIMSTVTTRRPLTTYTFKVLVEPDEDRWRAWCPSLEHLGAATWGHTREEALRHIREVLELVVSELVEEGEPVPADMPVSRETLVSITV